MSAAAAQIRLAQQFREAGDHYEAALHQRRAITLLRDGDVLALGQAIRHLAELLVEGGAADEAAVPVAELLALYQVHDVPPVERANALRCAALQVTATGDDETAIPFWAEARTRYEATGSADGVAEANARIAALRG